MELKPASTSISTGYDKTFELWSERLPPQNLGEVYDKIGWSGWRALLKRDFLELSSRSPQQSILDMGCFRGDYLSILLKGGGAFKYTGVDVTPEYIQYAEDIFSPLRKAAEEREQTFSFQKGTIFCIPFPDSHFDFVICSGVLIHLPELTKPMEELVRVAKGPVLIGAELHRTSEPEVSTVKNGFLYKTWSKEFFISNLEKLGEIESVKTCPSPDYDYDHASIILHKRPL